ncbi:hypothetical protein FACS189490_05110 [Clostridia bacterium]|nr:hypothetical protein FACS189490_05110 [Clostridia bacterium]
MPTVLMLAFTGESFVVSDPKGEVFRTLGGVVKSYEYDVIALNFREPTQSNFWNPLAVPYSYYKSKEFSKTYEYLSELAKTIFDFSSDDPYWDEQSRTLFIAISLILFEFGSAEMVNMHNIRVTCERLFDDAISNAKEVRKFVAFLKSRHFDIYCKIEPIFRNAHVTRLCILSTFTMNMNIFQKEVVESMMIGNEINYANLSNKKTAIFLIMPDEKATYHKFVSIFVKQCYDELIATAQDNGGELKRRINFLLDEFSTIPRIPDIITMLTAARSRQIRFVLVVQSYSQLKSKYQDDADTIMANCANWIYLFSRETELLHKISVLSGILPNGRPLLNVSQLQYLEQDAGEAVVLRRRNRPFITMLADISDYLDLPLFAKASRKNACVTTHKEKVKYESFDFVKILLHAKETDGEVMAEIESRIAEIETGDEDLNNAIRAEFSRVNTRCDALYEKLKLYDNFVVRTRKRQKILGIILGIIFATLFLGNIVMLWVFAFS